MKKKMQRMMAILLCMLTLSALCVTVSADMGPKPSVTVTFENIGDGLCYATLLSQHRSTGPSSAWDGDPEHARHNGNGFYGTDPAIWQAFVDYEDADGFYFLQETWQVNDSKTFKWGYYPPRTFKILLYYPESDRFVVSGIYERYAFDSYFTVDLSEPSDGVPLKAHCSYEYRGELISLAARIVITIAIEMLVALVFGLRRKKQLVLLAWVNIATQVILNVALNVINYRSGSMAFVVFYVFFELAVVLIEAVLYCLLLPRRSESPGKAWFYVLYAFIANAVSFAAGLLTAQIFPGIF